MILISKVLLGSATVAMFAASAAVPSAVEAAHTVVAFFEGTTSVATAATAAATLAEAPGDPQAAPHCAGSCDAWAMLARAR